jgi:hypothetical protein
VRGITLQKFSSGLLLTLLTAAFLLASGGPAYSQSNTRSFQMALWDYSCPAAHLCPDADADIATFWPTEEQPAGRPILLFGWNWTVSLYSVPYDWSRIVGVEIDEPYTNALLLAFGGDQKANPCSSSQRMAVINSTMQLLAARAAELKNLAPLARFWVDFTDYEVDWMRDSVCPQPLNQPYIDVISVDAYYRPFDDPHPNSGLDYVKEYYDWFVSYPATPQQQLALVPGTFYREGPGVPVVQSIPSEQAAYLQGYFDYANNANQTCNLPLGSRGVTGSYDGCRVWAVMGWLAPNLKDGNTQYVGEQDPTAGPIAADWRAELALPLRPGLAHQRTRGQAMLPALQPALQILLK